MTLRKNNVFDNTEVVAAEETHLSLEIESLRENYNRLKIAVLKVLEDTYDVFRGEDSEIDALEHALCLYNMASKHAFKMGHEYCVRYNEAQDRLDALEAKLGNVKKALEDKEAAN